MLSALLSFLGGSAFRLIWEQIATMLERRQEHAQELQRMNFQAELEKARFERTHAAIRQEAELGVKLINVQSEADIGRLEMEGWASAVEQANKSSGVFLVDLWNGCVRPACATVAISLWVMALNSQSWIMSEWDKNLCGVILGFYFAARSLNKHK